MASTRWDRSLVAIGDLLQGTLLLFRTYAVGARYFSNVCGVSAQRAETPHTKIGKYHAAGSPSLGCPLGQGQAKTWYSDAECRNCVSPTFVDRPMKCVASV